MAYPEAQAARVRNELAGQRGIAEKRCSAASPFSSAATWPSAFMGRISSCESTPHRRGALLHEPGAKPFDLGPGGRAPAGWLLVAPVGYRTDAALRTWVKRGTSYAASLPKKAAKKSSSKR